MTTLAPAPVETAPEPLDAVRREPLSRGIVTWLVSNRLFTTALIAGAVLRIIVMVTYPPALEFFGDSAGYLAAADHLKHISIWHPPGYPVLLRIVSITGSLAVLTAVQHLLGLCAAVVVYRFTRRLGVGAVGGTVAALPLLIDCYQLDVEQFVLSESLFILILVLAVSAALRTQSDVGLRTPLWLGTLLAALTLTRTVGVVAAGAVAVLLLVQRLELRRLLVVLATFAIPVLGYAFAFKASYGAFGLQGYNGRYLYGTVAPFADCQGSEASGAGRILCPKLPTYARPGFNQFVWQSPAYHQLSGDGIQASQQAGEFARRTILEQPGATASTVARNVAHFFQPARDVGVRDWFAGSWQFPLPQRAPAWNITPATVGFHGEPQHGVIRVGPARLLRRAQSVLYTPGPLLLAAVVIAMIAVCWRRTGRGVRHGIALLAGTGLLLLVVPSATAGFDWRYLLPAQALLMPAGVVAARSLLTGLATTRRGWVTRWRVPAAAVAVGAVVATVLSSPPDYAATRLWPGDMRAVPSTAVVSRSLEIHVGRPTLENVACTRTSSGYWTAAVASFPVTATHHGGGADLVDVRNFAGAGLAADALVLVADPTLTQLLPSAVLSARYPRLAGRLYLRLYSVRGRLIYVDPHGSGAAAWTFQLPPAATTDRVGRACHPPLPPAPRLARMAPFTTAAQQAVAFGPAHQAPPLGTTYDVRWLSRTPMRRAATWHRPRAWQHIAGQGVTLSNMHPGATYCFSVRANRASRRTTAWSPPRCTTRLADDATLAATGAWRRYSGASLFYDGTYTATRQPGDTLSTIGLARRIAVVAYQCAGCGVLEVLLNGHRLHRLDLRSRRASSGLVTWTSRLHVQAGRVELRASGNNALVAVDAIGLQP